MESNISHLNALINIQTLRNSTDDRNATALKHGELIFVDDDTNKTIDASTDTLNGKNLKLVSKWNEQIFESKGVLNRSRLYNFKAKDASDAVLNEWSATISNCDITKVLQLKIRLHEEHLLNRIGSSGSDYDFIVNLPPEEITCPLVDADKEIFINHSLTRQLYKKINDSNSDFYEALVETEDGSYLDGGSGQARFEKGDEAALDTFIDTFSDRLKDADSTNDIYNDGEALDSGGVDILGTSDIAVPKLKIIIRGKELSKNTDIYNTLEINYLKPRGVRLIPTMSLNSGARIIRFTEDVDIAYRIGHGYDLREEEWRWMSQNTNLQNYPTLPDGRTHKNVIYQIENHKSYNTISVEYDSPKTFRAGTADMRRYSLTVAIEADAAYTATYNRLKRILDPTDDLS